MTKIYGCSDDLIEFDGDVSGEVGHYDSGRDEEPMGALVFCSDGTLLRIYYPKPGRAIWGIDLMERGNLFDRLDICTDENAKPYSDVAHFRDGLKWVYVATRWEKPE